MICHSFVDAILVKVEISLQMYNDTDDLVNSAVGRLSISGGSRMKSQSKSSTELPTHYFERKQDWYTWLNKNHTISYGV